jgi:hypothetical protein
MDNSDAEKSYEFLSLAVVVILGALCSVGIYSSAI